MAEVNLDEVDGGNEGRWVSCVLEGMKNGGTGGVGDVQCAG